TYSGRRSPEWIKVKSQRRQEFVIGGYTAPQGSRARFGALQVGVYDGPSLVYVTKVGTGFDQRMLDSGWEGLEPLRRPTSPFDVRSPKGRDHVWVEPRLVCEVRFTEWTRDGGLRHPTFMGLRTDKRPEEVVREEPDRERSEPPTIDEVAPVEAEEPERSDEPEVSTRRRAAHARSTAPAPRATPKAAPAESHEVKISNPNKVFWPKEGYTKSDLVGYYEAIAPLMLPYLRDRPIVLT